MAPAVLADARPRAAAGRGRAEAGRRHGAVRPPGRRAVRHADRADRRGRAPERQRRRGARGARGPRRGRGRRRGRRRRRRATRTTTTTRTRTTSPRTGTTPSLGENGDGQFDEDEEQLPEQPEDPGAARRFWFEHATGAGKTVAALGFVEASRTGGILILTHRRNLVDQFLGELRDRGYSEPHLAAAAARPGPRRRPRDGRDLPVVRAQRRQHLGRVHDRDLRRGAHRARREDQRLDPRWQGPVFIGMTATGALIARHVTDLFPTQTSRFDLAQAARRGVIAPLRCVRIPPGRERAHARQGAAAKGRGRPGLRPGGAGRAARPGPVQRRRRGPLPRALQAPARHRLQRRRQARPQRREGVQGRRHEGRGRLGRDAQARAGAHPGRVRARRDRRARQRDAARRGLELPARDRLHAPRADRLASASTSSASAASRAATRARRRASSSTSCTRRPRTTSRS